MESKHKFLFVFLLLLALSVRLLFIDAKSLHADEPFSHVVSKNSFGELLKPFDYTWPSGYYVVLHFWGSFSSGFVWARFLSVLFGFFSLLALYCYSKRFFGEKTALTVLALASFSWIHIFYSQELRAYTIILFLSIVSFFSFFLAAKQNQKKQWVVFGLASFAGVFISYFQLVVLLVCAAYFALFARNKKNALVFSAVFLVSLLIALPWFGFSLEFMLQKARLESEYLKIYPAPIFAVAAIFPAFSSGNPAFPFAFFSLPIVLFALFLFFKRIRADIDKFVAFCFFAPLVVVVPFVSQSSFFETRHYFFLFGFFAIMVAKGLWEIKQRRIVFLLLGMLVFANLFQVWGTADFLMNSEKTWKSLAGCVDRNIGGNDVVVLFTHGNAHGFNYYFSRRNASTSSKLESLKTTLQKHAPQRVWVFYSDEMRFFDENSSALKFLESNSVSVPCYKFFVIGAGNKQQ